MSNNRASLLTGLRTGGPRSVSNGAYNVPHSAALGGQFINPSAQYLSGLAYDGDFAPFVHEAKGVPMTAPAQDATFPQQHQQQQAHLMLLQAQAQAQAVQNAVMANQGNLAYSVQSNVTPEQQAMQLQLEVYKMQAMHQQQLQVQIFQEAQRQILLQQQQQQQNSLPSRRRPSEPATASPFVTSFGTNVKNRTVSAMTDGPMTAGLDGRFPPSKLNPNASTFQFGGNEPIPVLSANTTTASSNWRPVERSQSSALTNTPATPNFNGVLSGGTLLGSSTSPAGTGIAASPAKHTLATSWRRPSVAKSADNAASRTPSPTESLSASPPTVYVSTPEETSPVQSRSTSPPVHRTKPQPLRFNGSGAIMEHQNEDSMGGQVVSFPRSMSDAPSSPVTPTSGSSTQSLAREEAARRLYEGLGIGRPAPQAIAAETVRHVSQPSRQPHGPPSGVEDLGARNFAARIRRKAIGGLGVLMDARGRRSSMIEVEAY